MEIGIVGSGISGISAAYHLQNQHKITLFEREDSLGGHTNSIAVSDDEGQSFNIDTGFIVFNDRNYKHFSKFIEELEVPTVETDMSFSYTDSSKSIGYAGTSNGLFPTVKSFLNPRHTWRLWNIYKYSKLLDANSDKFSDRSISIHDALKGFQCPDDVIDSYFTPIASAIWSCNQKDSQKIPANAYVNFFQNHGLLSISERPAWFTIKGGSKQYLKKFEETFKGNIKKGNKVVSIIENSSKVEVRCLNEPAISFDAVILATHADISAKIHTNTPDSKMEVLNQYKYSDNFAVLHKDVTYMPSNEKVWASWNVKRQIQANQISSFEVTYNMNRLQRLTSKTNFLVTLNPTQPPDPNMTLYSTKYTHPILSFDCSDNEKHFDILNSTGRVFFCGAYLGYGFHEDGFVSGMKAAQSINKLPG
ncbi:MAG: FAD-dependent oxidoreductase [Chloroflexota bacterium]|nr:FAD-dependent oxidoreductase [Chloroflexota bacterium]